METMVIADDKAGAVVTSRLGADDSFTNVAKGPSTMPMIMEGFIPEANPGATAQGPVALMTNSAVVSGAEFLMPSEQAALLQAPHAVGPVNLGPFAGSQNVMVINSTFTMADNLLMGQHTPNLVSQKPNSSTLFTGRKEVLEQLKVHFAPHVDRKRRMFLLYGMGGIGKTQICLKFAEEMSDLISKVFWVDASSTDTITLSLKAISGNADTSALSTLQQIAALEDEWLLVFDNANGGPEVVEKFLPPESKGNILITSRNLALQRITLVENSLGLPEMAKADAVILLQKSSGLVSLVKDQPELAEKIVSELCCLPLAVDQAGAAIHSGLCNVHKYLEHLSHQRKRLMSHSLFKGASQYDRTVYGTWELSYNEIETRAMHSSDADVAQAAQTAILILQICAFYHYDNISEDIFRQAAEKSRLRDIQIEMSLGLPLAITYLDY
ncbi:P-loop containing nucleoside triphosphate hydrolase protein, partial [Crassisporium funariophilum]